MIAAIFEIEGTLHPNPNGNGLTHYTLMIGRGDRFCARPSGGRIALNIFCGNLNGRRVRP
jgi:hypothetical protein